MKLTPEAIAYAATRGISEQTLTKMRVVGGPAKFGDELLQSITFPYFENGELVNYKSRAITEKKYKQKLGGKQIGFNWDLVRQSTMEEVWITEGEFDALALVEAGVPPDRVISVPAGAPPEESEDPTESKRYVWAFAALADGLSGAGRYLIATDNDGAGRALRGDLVAILGKAKVCFIDWPEGTKDANQYLMERGKEELAFYLSREVKQWPVKGLYTMSQVPEPPALELWGLGWPELGNKINFAPTTLSVVTGFPGHGKSHMMQQVWFNIAREYGVKVAMFSAETRIKPFLRRNLRQFYHAMPEYQMDSRQLREADNFIEAHFILRDPGDDVPTMPWMIDSIEIATQRHGCRAAVIDPWNKIEEDYDPRKETETRWIGRMLDLLIQMSRGLSIHTQIIAHPAKPDAAFRKSPPDLYSISGSQHWANRVDLGLCVYREKLIEGATRQTGAQLKVLKSRFQELGWPCSQELDFDLAKQRFKCIDFETRLETAMAKV